MGWQAKRLTSSPMGACFIDETRVSEYKIAHKKDDSLSLTKLMQQCGDFANETSRLVQLAQDLGVSILFSTKYHAELAGEGIEYDWAHGKLWFRRCPLSEKKSKGKIHELVKRATSREVVPVPLARMGARKARMCILAYHLFENGHISPTCLSVADKSDEGGVIAPVAPNEADAEEGDADSANNNQYAGTDENMRMNVLQSVRNLEITYFDIKNLVKKIKTHRCVMDMSHGLLVQNVRLFNKNQEEIPVVVEDTPEIHLGPAVNAPNPPSQTDLDDAPIVNDEMPYDMASFDL